jgi:UDP-GlcNAc:undecaprenyl-phosphate GlcNAc-1-phosphate transferase
MLSCVLSLALTPLCRAVSLRFGIVDRPDRKRKFHSHPIPRVGGVAIFLALAVSMGALAIFEPTAKLQALDWGDVTRSLPAVILIFLTGLLDDLVGLTPWQKLGGQISAAVLAFASGVQIVSLGGHSIAETWWHAPLTVLWLVACSNAFNLIDGVDGLAAGIGLFATITMFIAALWTGNAGLALATAPLAGALLAFLKYNFNPATIFLGDCGSLSIGFLLGCASVIWSQKSATLLGMTAPLIALSIPIIETVLSIGRRLLRGQSIFAPDRGHIHHRLLDLGLTPMRVALVLYAVAGAAAGCSLLVSVSGDGFAGLVITVCCVGVCIGVRQLGYGEFQEARLVLFGGVIGRVISDRLALRTFEENLRAAGSSGDCWPILTEVSRKLGFNEVRLEFCGRVRTERLGTASDSDCWRLQVPLDRYGLAEFSLPTGATPHPATLAPFAAIVSRYLTAIGPRVGGGGAVHLPWSGVQEAEHQAVEHA